MLPKEIVFVRHGQSESNLLTHWDINGGPKRNKHREVPDHAWRLTDNGVKQALNAKNNLPLFVDDVESFLKIVSPFSRAKETASFIDPSPKKDWIVDFNVREQSWGEIDGISKTEWREHYPYNHSWREKDPLFWCPPGGESVITVVENRVAPFFESLKQLPKDSRVLVVTHGMFIKAVEFFLERPPLHELKAFFDNHVDNLGAVSYSKFNGGGYGLKKTAKLGDSSEPFLYRTSKVDTTLGNFDRLASLENFHIEAGIFSPRFLTGKSETVF